MAMHNFSLFNLDCGESVALIKMDDSLLVEVVDPATNRLRVKGGGNYTLNVLEPMAKIALDVLKQTYDKLSAPGVVSMRQMIGLSDGVMSAVGGLFQSRTFCLVETVDDLEKVIKPGSSKLKEITEIPFDEINKKLTE